MRQRLWNSAVLFAIVSCAPALAAERAPRDFNAPYVGRYLDRVAFPIGGMGAGMFCLEGTGAISHVSFKHHMEFFNEPALFAAVCVLGQGTEPHVARVIEGPIPEWKYFGASGTGNGGAGTTYGLPRFKGAEFTARFPFAEIALTDPAMPLKVSITGWSPFTPPDPDPSSLPVGGLEYRFQNASDKAQRAVFSFNTRHFMGEGSIGPIQGGFVLYQTQGEDRDHKGAFALWADAENVVVDHCWFRGGWWDALTIAWNTVASGGMVDNPPVPNKAPGASLFVPFELQPGEERTIRILMAWYVPTSEFRFGSRTSGPAFREGPSQGSAENGQQPVSGFLGAGLVNTFDPDGDGSTGSLTSPEFLIDKTYLHFLVGGGSDGAETCVRLVVDGEIKGSCPGKQSEQLEWTTINLDGLQSKKGRIVIVDGHTEAWGHILADHFVLSNEPLESLRTGQGNVIVQDPNLAVLLQDFEGKDYGEWTAESSKKTCGPGASCSQEVPSHYIPWYARQFDSVLDVADHWRRNYGELRSRSEAFRDAFYDTTLPPEVIEAAAANLTILKTPTVLRQHDGRLWCYEGCGDSGGCCAGSCTHVWNYAQALCHMFPSLERSLRQTEYFESQDDQGRQAFRANLPIAPGGGAFDASDGQLGGIMKAYREWRILGDDPWLEQYWPRVKQSLDYMIEKYDPRHTGLLEEDHHNTYDINYFGPDGHCGSFYLGALTAAIEMGKRMNEDVGFYHELLRKGRKRMESELFNGSYFIQIVQKEGLDHNFHPIEPKDQSEAYQSIAEIVNEQGPKYQYGNGCLSDGVLGLWMAKVCGIDEDIVDTDKVKSHLLAVYENNLKRDLSCHANPQRPTFAMGDDGGLLLCSWPQGGKPILPFVYSDEVWTGIEYQVASHLMLLGCVDQGLDIVRTCRRRYDGIRRNPFNEYECGHWYARAMSSYALLQGLTGLRYDARDKILHVDSQIGDFRSFLCTETGFGVVELKGKDVSIEVRHGGIPVDKALIH